MASIGGVLKLDMQRIQGYRILEQSYGMPVMLNEWINQITEIYPVQWKILKMDTW